MMDFLSDLNSNTQKTLMLSHSISFPNYYFIQRTSSVIFIIRKLGSQNHQEYFQKGKIRT